MADHEPLIEFIQKPNTGEAFPEPRPAGHFVPDWFSRMNRETDVPMARGVPGLSVKACMPVTDCFTLGYIIPLPCQLDLEFAPGGRFMRSLPHQSAPTAMGMFSPLMPHLPVQVGAPNPPFETQSPLKFINPWLIKVPDDYSVLFIHPMNHHQLPFQIFAGLVDCDSFNTTVNFPFYWTAGEGTFTLDQGMPMVQVIPIKRSALIKQYGVRGADPAEVAAWDKTTDIKHSAESAYRKQWRQKK